MSRQPARNTQGDGSTPLPPSIPSLPPLDSLRDRGKEADLLFAVLTFASRCVAEGDIQALYRIGFEPVDVLILEKMSLPDLFALTSARGHPLTVHVDRGTWEWALEHTRRQRARQQLLIDLIREDAPQPLMSAVFGLTSRDYAARRQAYGVARISGRTRGATAKEADSLWRLWVRLARDDRPHQLRKDDLWLIAHRESGVPLRTMWDLIRQWSHDKQSLDTFRKERAILPEADITQLEAALRDRHLVART